MTSDEIMKENIFYWYMRRLLLILFITILILGGYMFYLMHDLGNSMHQQTIEFKTEIQQARQSLIESIQKIQSGETQ